MLPSITYGTWFDNKEDNVMQRKEPRKKRLESSGRSVNRQAPFLECTKALTKSGVRPLYSKLKILAEKSVIDWRALPFSVSVEGGLLPKDRCWRKVIQVENMVLPAFSLLLHALQKNIQYVQQTNHQEDDGVVRVVEFCAGSGFVLLPLAALLRQRRPHFVRLVEFVLLDRKGRSIEIARERVRKAGLDGMVRVQEQRIEEYEEPFDIGIALHACGGASDYSIEQSVAKRAAFIVCSCCVGKIPQYRCSPLSNRFKSSVENNLCIISGSSSNISNSSSCNSTTSNNNSSNRFTTTATTTITSNSISNSNSNSNNKNKDNILGNRNMSFLSLIKAADFGHGDAVRVFSDVDRSRRLCKSYVEEDRRRFTEERGYYTHIVLMNNIFASPKNDMVIGYPINSGYDSTNVCCGSGGSSNDSGSSGCGVDRTKSTATSNKSSSIDRTNVVNNTEERQWREVREEIFYDFCFESCPVGSTDDLLDTHLFQRSAEGEGERI